MRKLNLKQKIKRTKWKIKRFRRSFSKKTIKFLKSIFRIVVIVTIIIAIINANYIFNRVFVAKNKMEIKYYNWKAEKVITDSMNNMQALKNNINELEKLQNKKNNKESIMLSLLKDNESLKEVILKDNNDLQNINYLDQVSSILNGLEQYLNHKKWSINKIETNNMVNTQDKENWSTSIDISNNKNINNTINSDITNDNIFWKKENAQEKQIKEKEIKETKNSNEESTKQNESIEDELPSSIYGL